MAEENKPSAASQVGNAVKNEAVNRGTKWLITKIITKGVTGPSGYIATEAATKAKELYSKNKGKLGNILKATAAAPFLFFAGIASVIGAGVAALGTALTIAIIAVPLTVAFFLTIINNSAYMVPPAVGTVGIGAGPGLEVGATCPIPDGDIFLGVYGSTTNVYSMGHGENEYWPAVGAACGQYRISGCYARVPTDCAASKGVCSSFGLAIDVRYPGGVGNSAGRPAYYPYIDGKSSEWVLASPNTDCNCAGTVRTVVDGNVYEMYISHLTGLPQNGQSGSPIGILNGDDHIHIELRVNGQWVDPTSMCSGSGIEGPTIDNLETDSTGSFGTRNCTSSGGQCYSPGALRLIYPLVSTLETCEDVDMETINASRTQTGQLCCGQ